MRPQPSRALSSSTQQVLGEAVWVNNHEVTEVAVVQFQSKASAIQVPWTTSSGGLGEDPPASAGPGNPGPPRPKGHGLLPLRAAFPRLSTGSTARNSGVCLTPPTYLGLQALPSCLRVEGEVCAVLICGSAHSHHPLCPGAMLVPGNRISWAALWSRAAAGSDQPCHRQQALFCCEAGVTCKCLQVPWWPLPISACLILLVDACWVHR